MQQQEPVLSLRKLSLTAPVVYPFDVVGGTDLDGLIVGAWGERFCCLSIFNNLFHATIVGFVDAPLVILEVGVYVHDVERIGRRFRPF